MFQTKRLAIFYAGTLPLLLMIGCNSSQEKLTQDNGTKGPQMTLTAQQARKALIDLVNDSDDMLMQHELPSLKKGRLVKLSRSRFAIGNWHFDLQTKTFVIDFPIERVVEYRGSFVRTAKGKWEASITGSVQQ